MTDDVFRKLADHLNGLPGGFPPTDSGVEIRILKRLFTPREAEIATALTPMLEPAEAVAERMNRNVEELAPELEAMSRKGLILRSERGERTLYMAAQFVVGIWEYHVNDLDKELIEEVNEYIPHLIETAMTQQKTQQLRVVPVSQSISAEMRVMPYEVAEEIIKRESKILVAPCICRKEHKMMDRGCEKPMETCLVFGGGAYFYEGNGIGRTISQDEALEILKKGVEAGLVLQPGNSKRPMNICMCCGCCCQILKNLKKMEKPAQIVNSNYYAQVDTDACTACGVCADRCEMDAVTVEEIAQVATERCIGCGLCVASCEYDAMKLMQKAEAERWDPPKTAVDTFVAIGKERGLL